MSEGRIEQAMVSIRLRLDTKTLLTRSEIDDIAGEDAEIAIARMYQSGQIAKTLAAGYEFYSLTELAREN